MFAARNMMMAAAGVAFDPLSLSPAIWLDASDTGTVWDATTGGSNCTNGGAIKRIDDKSGNGRHFTEGTNFPKWASSGVKGLGAIAMEDSKILARTGGTFAGTDFDNIFIVSKTSDAQYLIIGTGSAATYLDATDSVSASVCYTALTIGQFRVNGSNVSAARNALYAARGTAANVLSMIGASAQGDAWGTPRIGYTTGVGGYNVSSGYFCEMLVFTGTMTTTDRDAVEAYLTAKWI